MIKSLFTPSSSPAVAGPDSAPARRAPLALSKPLSEEASNFAQTVINLQNENTQLHSATQHLEGELTLAHTTIDKLEREIDDLKHQLDYYKTRTIQIETKLTTAGQIILDVLRPSPAQERADEALEHTHAIDAIAASLQLDPPLTPPAHESSPERAPDTNLPKTEWKPL